MRALVTGGAGFLGRYIVEQLLERGDDVRSFARGDYPELEAIGVESVRGDLRDEEAVTNACAGIDAVFHTAAIAGIWGPWAQFFEINTLGTRHVISACARQSVAKLIFTSSPSVTFDGSDQRGVDESAPYPRRWLCHYPHTKAIAEGEVLQANGRGGLLTCALRPHLIWGPRDQHLIPRLLQRARQGKLLQIGDGRNLVDMIYVENAASAHLQAADALTGEDCPVAGQVYFLSQGSAVNCWDWIAEILEIADLPRPRRSLSLRTAWFLGLAMELGFAILRRKAEPRMTRFLASQLANSHYFDISRARRDFGYQVRVSTADGMQRLAEWIRS